MPQEHRAVGGRTLEGLLDPPPRFCTVSEAVTAVHGPVHPPHHLPPVQVPPGVPGHAGVYRGYHAANRSVGYCYPTDSQRDAPPRDGDLGTPPCRARAARSSRPGAPGALAPRPPPRRQHRQRRQRETGGGGAGEKAEFLRLEAENKLLREQLKAAEAARKTAQEALTGERAAWERREKGWEKQRAELQQQLSATPQVRAVWGGGQRVAPTPPCAVPAGPGGCVALCTQRPTPPGHQHGGQRGHPHGAEGPAGQAPGCAPAGPQAQAGGRGRGESGQQAVGEMSMQALARAKW